MQWVKQMEMKIDRMTSSLKASICQRNDGYNEDTFPDWVKASAHHSADEGLIISRMYKALAEFSGKTLCQKVGTENADPKVLRFTPTRTRHLPAPLSMFVSHMCT